MKLSFVSRPRLVGLAGLMAVALFLFLVARFWHPVYGFSVFFQLDASNDELKITAFRELPVYVHRDTGPYDGLYYAQIAQDPTLRDPELPRAMDNLSYRARRILPSALAWILGAGQPAWIVHAYSLINVMAWLALALLLWRLLAVRDARSGFAWAGVMFSAGALSSVRLALTDLPALTLIAAALLAEERGRRRLATALLATSGLARETSLLAFAGMDTRPWILSATSDAACSSWPHWQPGWFMCAGRWVRPTRVGPIWPFPVGAWWRNGWKRLARSSRSITPRWLGRPCWRRSG